MSVSRPVYAFALSALIVLLAQQPSSAQQGGISTPYNPKPTVSPYLNLLQGGGSAFNFPQYQALVRPFLDQQVVNNRNAFNSQSLQRQVNSIQGQVNRGDGGRATGHPTRYMNYSHYYSMGR